jgi:ABC-type lipoprotein export system ATPase subunit
LSDHYTYARFWKCALQVNPERYSANYRGQDHGLRGQDFLDALVSACLDNGIEVVGLADHGSVQDLDRIRSALSVAGIVVFPGFEVATTEKVHWVCLFPEDTHKRTLERCLGQLELSDPEDGVTPSNLGGARLLEIVQQQYGGFCYAAHVTQKNGLLKQKINHLWRLPALRAAQIPGSMDDLPPEYKSIAKNHNPDYTRERRMALINAKDVAQPEDLAEPGASCWIKMTRPCFDAFVTAFKDPDSRLRLHHEMAPHHYSRIEAMEIDGGYLDGLRIRFSDHLNTAIGGRGTGKSTLLECLRYALDLEHKAQDARKQGDRIVRDNLRAAGTVSVTLVSAASHGNRYRVKRRFGEPPRVIDADGNVSELHPTEDLLPRLECYGQNEIFELARSDGALVDVLSRFMPGDAESTRRLDELRKALTDNAERLARALAGQDDLEQDLERLPKLNEQVAQYQALGVEAKLKQVPLLEKERQLKPRFAEEWARLDKALETFAEELPDLTFLSDAVLDGLPHAEILRRGRTLLAGIKTGVADAVNPLRGVLDSAQGDITALTKELDQALEGAERSLEAEFAKLPDVGGKRGAEVGRTYQALLRQIEQIQPKQARLQTARDLTASLRQERRNLLNDWSDLRSARTTALEGVAKTLNKRLRGKVKIRVLAGGDRTALKDWLCEFPGISEKRVAWVDEAEGLTIPALVTAARAGEDALRATDWGLTTGGAQVLAKLDATKLMELETIDLGDRIDLQLNVSHEAEQYRSLHQLSTGQQCTAILNLLLIDNQDPLIMDQPEDNLDNAFIAERIVTELRSAKTERQFIFATHNANIPVFGDAEWIGVFSASEEHGAVPSDRQGSIDVPVIRDEAARILEGGRTAFQQRQEIYGY